MLVIMPIRLMAKQRKVVYNNKGRIGNVNAAKEARDIVLDAWLRRKREMDTQTHRADTTVN